MPDKITSKNLSYDQTLPPFLARLRGQQVSDSQSPDPILAARRRPGRIRSASEDAEDAPIVVDEEGNVVHLKADQLGGEDEDEEQQDESINTAQKEPETKPDTEKVAGIGAAKKRKIGRVVGGSGEDGSNEDIAKAVKATRAMARNGIKEEVKPITKGDGERSNKKVKKVKKVKLSFGDDEG
ncbi:hypothetical protein BJ170DRAFT_624805 [Xylariales sp. AK1849]|nr:hypothetical protein BJ170DRAFT_624805 [Xylariales sp. AK1849]